MKYNEKHEDKLMQTTLLPKDPHVMYQTQMKWHWDLHAYKISKNIVEMGLHKINEHMGKVDPRCR
jgi:hypothetical protein